MSVYIVVCSIAGVFGIIGGVLLFFNFYFFAKFRDSFALKKDLEKELEDIRKSSVTEAQILSRLNHYLSKEEAKISLDNINASLKRIETDVRDIRNQRSGGSLGGAG